MLWFSLFFGLLMIFLFAMLYWTKGHIYYDPFLIKILLGDFILWFDPRLLPILAFSLFCFTLLMAGLILYRNGNRADPPLTIREGFTGACTHAGPLAALSITMALAGTILFVLLSSDNSDFFYNILFPLIDAYLPYHYFLPGPTEFTITIMFFGTILFVNIILFLALLYVVPVIVLENKRLLPALAGSVRLMMKIWRELVGCILVYGTIVLLVGAIALVIGQIPELLNYDLTFFYSHGLLPIMAVCAGFILFCFMILMAACSTAAGIAIADLYRAGKNDPESGIPEGNLKKPEPAS
jgi:hypothetical protein